MLLPLEHCKHFVRSIFSVLLGINFRRAVYLVQPCTFILLSSHLNEGQSFEDLKHFNFKKMGIKKPLRSHLKGRG